MRFKGRNTDPQAWVRTALVVALLVTMQPFAAPRNAAASTPSALMATSVVPAGQQLFQSPSQVVLSGGVVHVVDTGGDRVVSYTSAGAYLRSVGQSGPGKLLRPEGAAVDASGNLYVADTGNSRVVKFSAAGEYVTAWDGSATASGRLLLPRAVAVDGSGNVVVADSGNSRIVRFSQAGGYVGQFATFAQGSSVAIHPTGDVFVADPGGRVVYRYSSSGVFEAHVGPYAYNSEYRSAFDAPTGVTCDASGYLWVVEGVLGARAVDAADPDVNARTWAPIQKWRGDSSDFGLPNAGTPAFRQALVGTVGTGAGQVRGARGITVAADGSLWVAEAANNRVQHLTAAGASLEIWDGRGVAPGTFDTPEDVEFVDGGMLVLDAGNGRVQKLDAAGAPVSAWGSKGSGSDQLADPASFAVGPTGDVYVADTGNNRVSRFSADGVHVQSWGSAGSSAGQFLKPRGIAVDAAGNVYVADTGNHRVQKFDATGAYVTQWGSLGSGPGQFSSPDDLAIDGLGNLYVSDTGNNRIQRFSTGSGSTPGALLGSFGGPGQEPGKLSAPGGLAADPAGGVVVADAGNGRLQHFGPDGTLVRAWGTTGIGLGQFRRPSGVAFRDGAMVATEAGNHRLTIFGRDTLPPVSRHSGVPDGWSETPVTVTLSAEDTQTSVARIEWRRSGEPTQTYAGPIAVTTQGATEIEYWAVDAAGNVEAPNRVTVRYAKPLSGVMQLDAGAAVTTSRTVQVRSSVANAVSMRIDAGNGWGEWIGYTTSIEVALPADGVREVSVQYRNAGDATLTLTDDILVDTTAPASVADFTPSQWAEDPITVTLSADDGVAGTGVEGIWYRMDGGEPRQFDEPIVVADEVPHVLEYWSRDVAGNVEPTRSASVWHSSVPSGTVSLGHGAAYARSSAVTLSVDVAGAAEMRVDPTGSGAYGAWQPFSRLVQVLLAGEGAHTVAVELRNSSSDTIVRTDDIVVDTQAPTTVPLGVPADWSDTPVTVTLDASDAVSGVAVTRYRVAGGAFVDYQGPFVVSREGVTDIDFYSVDHAGNVEATRTVTVRYSTGRPYGSMALAAGAYAVKTTLVPVDSSVADATEMRIDAGGGFGPWRPYDSTVAVPLVEGEHVVTVEYRRVPGGPVLVLSDSIIVDSTAPYTAALGVPPVYSGAPVEVTLASADLGSGIARTWYRVGSGPALAYAGPFTVSAEGETVVTFWSEDRAGNVEPARQVTVRYSAASPSGAMVLADGAEHVATGVVPLRSAVSDAIEMRIDTGSGFGAWLPYADLISVTLNGAGEHTVAVEYRSLSDRRLLLHDTVNVDLEPPSSAATGIPDSVAEQPVTVSLSATDSGGSGVSAIRYRVGAGPWQVYDGPFSVAFEGVTPVTYFAEDAAGNAEEPHVATVRYSSARPVGVALVSAGAAAIATTTATVDSLVVGATEMRIDVGTGFGAWQPFEPQVPVVLPGGGTRTVTVEYRNELDRRLTVADTIIVDLVPPVTTASGPPSGWSSQPVTVTLTASDAGGSGVVSTHYRIAGGPERVYVEPFVVTDEGDIEVSFWSVDGAGNVEAPRTVRVRYTTAEPSGTMVLSGGSAFTGAAGSIDSSMTGVLEMRIDMGAGYGAWRPYEPLVPITYAVSGPCTVRVQYRSQSGTVIERADDIVVDLTAPVVSISGVAAGWSDTPVTFTLTASDAGSGVAQRRYRLGDGPVRDYDGPVTIDTEGATTVEYWAVDAVGNESAHGTTTVRYSSAYPQGTMVVAGGAAWVSTPTVPVASAVSHASSMRFDAGGYTGTWQPYAAESSVTLAEQGMQVVTATYRDDVTGRTLVLTDTVGLDTQPPATTAIGVPAGWSEGPVTIQLVATDALSGIAETSWRTAGGAWRSYSPADGIEVSELGETTIEFRSTDVAGNAETIREAVVRVAVRTPSGTMRVAGGAASSLTSTLTVDSEVVGATQMRVDVGPGFGAWVPYADRIEVVATSDGTATVTVEYRSPLSGPGETLTLSADVLVDTAPPVTEISGVPATWTDAPVTIELAPSDAGSGVASTWYRIDGQNPVRYTGPIEWTREGETEITFWSVDRLGRVEAPSSAVIRYLTQAPTGVMSLSGGADYDTDGVVSVDADVSGATEMRIDTGSGYGPWRPYEPALELAVPDGPLTVRAEYRNQVDHRLTLVDTIVVDTVAPVVTAGSETHPDPDVAYASADVEFDWFALDAGSFVAGYSRVLDRFETTVPDETIDTQDTWELYEGLAPGTWYLHVRACDNAGNWGPTAHVRVRIADVQRFSVGITKAPAAWRAGVPLTISAAVTPTHTSAGMTFELQQLVGTTWTRRAVVGSSRVANPYVVASAVVARPTPGASSMRARVSLKPGVWRIRLRHAPDAHAATMVAGPWSRTIRVR